MPVLRQEGYEAFAAGTFGNGGQNLYVSRKGVLQRIFRFDVNADGFPDIVFVNSQDMGERPETLVVNAPLGGAGLRSVPSQGAYAGALEDLNGDGFEDLVLAHQNNGTHSDLTAFLYYGSAEGLSERYRIELPAPDARGVAIGDFNGDGRPDLVFACSGGLRVFPQGERGFLAGAFQQFELPVTHLCAADLDGDGYCDLYVRVRGSRPLVLWGGPEGLNLARRMEVGGDDPDAAAQPGSSDGWIRFGEGWRPAALRLQGALHLFRAEGDQAVLYPVSDGRSLGEARRLECPGVVSAAAADLDGDGFDDLILAVRGELGAESESCVVWGDETGFFEGEPSRFVTRDARQVLATDLDGDGRPEVALCCGRNEKTNETESVVWKPDHDTPRDLSRLVERRFTTQDATTVLAGRTSAEAKIDLIFVHHCGGSHQGEINACAYLGGTDGFSPDRKWELPAWSAPAAAVTDLNDDGLPDIVICNCSEDAPEMDPGTYIYWGGTEPPSPDRRLTLPTSRAHGCAIGDFRHTGYLDLIVVGFDNPELRWFHGGPDGLSAERLQVLDLREAGKQAPGHPERDWTEPRWLLAADFNGDGWLDLFVSQCMGAHCMLFWGGPDGFSFERMTLLATEGAICAQAADLDGDGCLDLIVGGHHRPSQPWRWESSVTVYWGGPNGFQEHRRTSLPARTANALAVADFNRDGVLDLFATSYNGGRERDLDAYLYWGAPGGHFSAHRVQRFFLHSSCGVLANDLDGDGWVDLAVANHKTYGNHSGLSEVWWNGPDGFRPDRRTFLPTHGPHGMLAVDPGNIMDRSPEETYLSSALRLPEGGRLSGIRWEVELQPKTWVHAQVRTAGTEEALAAAVWQGARGEGSRFEDGSGGHDLGSGWVQYRLFFGAAAGGCSPRLTAVELEYACP